MIDEKWNAFMNSGKISDYLEYKNLRSNPLRKPVVRLMKWRRSGE